MCKIFDIEEDNKHPCFCQACLVGKKKNDMGDKDTWYCVKSQVNIEAESTMLANRTGRKLNGISVEPLQEDINSEKTKMSTSNENTVIVDKFKPRGRPKTYRKQPLPENEIEKLDKECVKGSNGWLTTNGISEAHTNICSSGDK